VGDSLACSLGDVACLVFLLLRLLLRSPCDTEPGWCCGSFPLPPLVSPVARTASKQARNKVTTSYYNWYFFATPTLLADRRGARFVCHFRDNTCLSAFLPSLPSAPTSALCQACALCPLPNASVHFVGVVRVVGNGGLVRCRCTSNGNTNGQRRSGRGQFHYHTHQRSIGCTTYAMRYFGEKR